MHQYATSQQQIAALLNSEEKAKVPKCCSLAVQASSGQVYDPQLSLCGQSIPHLGNGTFKFLGAPVTVYNSQEKARSALLEKLETMLVKVDATLLTSRQKLKLYKDAVCPCLTWDLSLVRSWGACLGSNGGRECGTEGHINWLATWPKPHSAGTDLRIIGTHAAVLWSQTVLALPNHMMRFALSSVTDTLPHNANLQL